MSDQLLPRFSYDLIELLDKDVPKPEVAMTKWTSLTEHEIRHLCFLAGARSLVEDLLDMRDNYERDEDEAELQD